MQENPKGDKILEIGCGLGRRAKRMAEAIEDTIFITAIDNS
jgi:ubiquinone/menaquinone biosynthesis C-methylase UbiE